MTIQVVALAANSEADGNEHLQEPAQLDVSAPPRALPHRALPRARHRALPSIRAHPASQALPAAQQQKGLCNMERARNADQMQ